MDMFDDLDSSSNDSLPDITDFHFETKPKAQPLNGLNSTRSYQCARCQKSFTHRKSLSRHEKSTHGSIIYRCIHCRKTFNRSDVLSRHINSKHRRSDMHQCPLCQKTFSRSDHLSNHLKTHTNRQQGQDGSGLSNKDPTPPVRSTTESSQRESFSREPTQPGPSVQRTRRRESAFKGTLVTEWLDNTTGRLDIQEFLQSKKDEVINILKDELKKKSLKVNYRLVCIYIKATDAGILREEKSFKTTMAIVLQSTNLEAFYKGACEKLFAESEDFQHKESGWTLEEILHLEVRINKFNPLRA